MGAADQARARSSRATWCSSSAPTGRETSPGHVGLVIGGGKMIEAYATGFPIRIAPYTGRDPIGFTRPWLHKGVAVPAVLASN